MSRTVLVTGGSSGIGLAISQALSVCGDRLLWVSRTEEELEEGKRAVLVENSGAYISSLALDLVSEGAADRVADWVKGLGLVPDVLINNAGFASWGFLDEIPEERDLAMFQLNMVVPYQLTRRFLPQMKERGSGRILNIASSAGIVNTPGFVSYGATKAFLRFYSMTLSLELQLEESGVQVTAICPGAVKDTAFQSEAGMEHTDIFSGQLVTRPEEIARDVVEVLERERPVLERVTGRAMRYVLPLASILPRSLSIASARKNLCRKATVPTRQATS